MAKSTDQRILDVARNQVMSRGMARFTLQGVADELDVTKQAVLYWFPKKTLLLQELFFEALETEAEVLTKAVEDASDAVEAVEFFLKRGLQYHKENVPRFRLSYLVAQVDRSVSGLASSADQTRVHQATKCLYDSLEQKFRNHPGFPEHVNPRNFAVSLHMSLLGHVCMYGAMEALDDKFKQTFEAMIDATIGVISEGLQESPC